MTFSGITPFMISLFTWMLDSAKTLGGIACVAGAKRGGGGGGRKEKGKGAPPLPNPPPLFPFLPIPYPLPLSTPATQAREVLLGILGGGVPLLTLFQTKRLHFHTRF